MKYFSLFSGIGSPEQALKNLGVEFELQGFSEIDKFAIKSYCEVHGVDKNLNLGDITKIDIDNLPKDIDLITHGSPCQDFSVAGNGKGGDIGTGTRSSLMWNTVAICEHCQPKYVIWENVKNVLSKKHRHNFDKYLDEMDRIGYKNFYQVLNAKDYGVPQNRERIFVVSIRKDIKKDFEFPKGFDNGIRLKDILENEVDEKYYINTEKAKELIEKFIATGKKHLNINPSGKGMNGIVRNDEIAGTITTNKGEGQKILTIGKINTSQDGIIVDTSGISPTHTAGHGNCTKIICPCTSPDIIEKNQNGRRFKEDNEPMFALTSRDRHGVYISKRIGGIFDGDTKHQAGSVWDKEGLAPTLDTMQGGYRQPCIIIEYRIRKLTPNECWRLMGFADEQFLKAEQVCSNSQLYKQAGNSIVVNVMENIFEKIFL